MAYDTQSQTTPRYGAGTQTAEIDKGLRAYMLRVYNYMASGLLLSGIVALAIVNTELESIFYAQSAQGMGLTTIGMIAMFAPLGLLLIGMFAGASMSATATQGLYWAFVTLQGVSISMLLQIYTGESVVRVFFITAAAFASLSLYGYTTKRDLTGLGKFMFMGLIGIVIAAIVNIFLGSSMLQFVISGIGVIVFSGLIAYDTQNIKQRYYEGVGHEEETKMAVWSALALYLNFINLLQFLLYFLGNRE
ncbi:MAG: Bax inhibitor-1/YccA family protein [Rhodospirillaceae bacterium]